MDLPNKDLIEAASKLNGCLERRLGVSNVEVENPRGPDGGHSANMILFTARWRGSDGPEEHELVVRMEQGGLALFPEHDLMHEFDIMSALATTPVPVPAVLFKETDPTPLGGPFYVMGLVRGRVVQDEPPYHVDGWFVTELTAAERAEHWYAGVDVLAHLHEVDYRENMSFLDHPELGESGLDQFVSWMETWFRWVMGGDRHPVLDAAMDYIRAEKPAGTSTSVLWGDARIGNLLYSEGKVAAAIDWELARLGPGEIDLAWWIIMDHLLGPGLFAPRASGLPSREETIARYEQTRGCWVGDLHYYEVLGVLRFAIILMRFAKMYTGSPLFPNGTDHGTNSHAMQMLAKLMDMPVPELSKDCLRLHRPDLDADLIAQATSEA